ncbi:MAG: hypothetical protein IT165_11910 [Bryobacterales bacterium]|nr:hypothetical protein [Bryobacterales bacterium]
MRHISVLSLVLAFFATALLSAQSLVESATAAAGGSAAGVAGRKVSEGIDSVFSKVADAAKSAAAEDGRKASRIAPAVPPIPEIRLTAKEQAELAAGANAKKSSGIAQTAGRQARLQSGAVSAEPAVSSSAPPASVDAPPASPTGPTLQDLESLSAGASRQQVLDKLGQPASRISMSNDDGFVEVMKFRNQDGSIGSVRVVNGKVTGVKVAQ